MTNEESAAVEHKKIFISHAHADRELARALTRLIERTYSNVVDVFFSSDLRSGGGLQPGDLWFARLHAALDDSLAVWVLVTPQSVNSPWVYWEAGIGSVRCPGGVVVLRTGIEQAPAPLNAFQAFDGSAAEDSGIGTLIDKVAGQLNMSIDVALRQPAIDEWLGVVEGFSPAADADDETRPEVTGERLGRFEAAVTRIESMASRLDFAVASLSPMQRLRRPARSAARTSFFVAYGTGLSAGDVVGVYAAGEHCGDITADKDGNWVGQVGPDGADASECDAVAGDQLTFTLNGEPTNETETFSSGGFPADARTGISLTLATDRPT